MPKKLTGFDMGVIFSVIEFLNSFADKLLEHAKNELDGDLMTYWTSCAEQARVTARMLLTVSRMVKDGNGKHTA